MRWVNDSQATIPLAAIAALEAFDAPIVLIAGGKDKGLDYAAFADAIASRVPRAAILIGETADELEALVGDRVPVRRASSMDEAVADRRARSPSPGTSSSCRRRRPASTCSSTTRPAATRSGPPSSGLESEPMTRRDDRRRPAAQDGARTGVRRERHEPAYALLLAVMALTAIGIVMVYSASSVRSYFSRADPAAQGLEQLVWAGIGLVGLVVAMRIDFRHLRYLAIPIYVITLVLLVVVLVPGIGAEINGSRRWIVIPGVGSLQPAEFAKLAIVLYLAHWLDRRGKAAQGFWNGLVPFGLLVAPGFLLIAVEPDLGTAGRVRGRRGQHLLHGRRQRALPGRDRARWSVRPG